MIITFFFIDVFLNNYEYEDNKPNNLLSIDEIKQGLLYIISCKTLFYFTTFVLTIFERKNIRKELKNSLFRNINDNLSKDIYENILAQCKYPKDTKLTIKYDELIKKSNISSKLNDVNLSNFKINQVSDKPLSKKINIIEPLISKQ